MISLCQLNWMFSAFFNDYLAAPQPTLGHCRGGNLPSPMLINVFEC